MQKVSCQQELFEKISQKKMIVGVVGMGYVGLPLSLRLVEQGITVLGFDVDADKISKLNAGETYIRHIDSSTISDAVSNNKFRATTNFSEVEHTDCIILCVPTPLNTYRVPDLSYIDSAMSMISPHLKKGQMISLESTTYPGTTEENLLPVLQNAGFNVGEDFFLIYSPEREDPGNANFKTQTIPKVVGGHTPNCLEIGKTFYEQIIDQVVPVSSTKVAELTKLTENIQRLVNIGLANELKKLAIRMDIDIFEVIEAAGTKPFGFLKYYPGPGVGGHCIPIDPFYLTWKAKEYGLHTRFIELAGEINAEMPAYVLKRVVKALNKHGKPISGAKILVLGIAYKRDVDDVRESPALQVMDELLEMDADVYYHDPYIPEFDGAHMKYKLVHTKSVEFSAQTLCQYDAVVITTGHKCFDFDLLQKHASLIVDTRGCYSADKFEHVIVA